MTDDTATTSPIILPLINLTTDPEVLIFNIDDAKKLRNEYNILGVLTGTLQQYPQQNTFLSVPLRLVIWEVLWLLKNKKAILVDQKAYRTARLTGEVSNTNYSGNLITTANTEPSADLELAMKYQVPVKEYVRRYLANSTFTVDTFIRYARYYSHLQNHGYFINPGLKFGGDLVIYPGDPLRYHSYSIVKFEFVDMHQIVVGGRLATSVKKNLVIMGERNLSTQKHDEVDDEVIDEIFEDSVPLTFSIEWAGFG
ncbi:tRNA-splicing endonuclease subunit SEN34 [Candida viswanathii]|uniref:tRNA-splicing endonuclease subunit Sen34 n=1 Tax=Candida viswanathii TaxID=5486 RepID=A0A367XNT1_9ASCO|nr:tRNA-splicing endonuclease subunit SEN34 [Candida viswanathii]